MIVIAKRTLIALTGFRMPLPVLLVHLFPDAASFLLARLLRLLRVGILPFVWEDRELRLACRRAELALEVPEERIRIVDEQ